MIGAMASGGLQPHCGRSSAAIPPGALPRRPHPVFPRTPATRGEDDASSTSSGSRPPPPLDGLASGEGPQISPTMGARFPGSNISQMIADVLNQETSNVPSRRQSAVSSNAAAWVSIYVSMHALVHVPMRASLYAVPFSLSPSFLSCLCSLPPSLTLSPPLGRSLSPDGNPANPCSGAASYLTLPPSSPLSFPLVLPSLPASLSPPALAPQCPRCLRRGSGSYLPASSHSSLFLRNRRSFLSPSMPPARVWRRASSGAGTGRVRRWSCAEAGGAAWTRGGQPCWRCTR